jgi:hypothetical protein
MEYKSIVLVNINKLQPQFYNPLFCAIVAKIKLIQKISYLMKLNKSWKI